MHPFLAVDFQNPLVCQLVFCPLSQWGLTPSHSVEETWRTSVLQRSSPLFFPIGELELQFYIHTSQFSQVSPIFLNSPPARCLFQPPCFCLLPRMCMVISFSKKLTLNILQEVANRGLNMPFFWRSVVLLGVTEGALCHKKATNLSQISQNTPRSVELCGTCFWESVMKNKGLKTGTTCDLKQ